MSIDASFSVAAYSCRQRRCSTFFQYALYTARVKSAALLLLLLRWHHMWLRIPLYKRIFSRSKTLPCAASNDHLVGSIDSKFFLECDSKKKFDFSSRQNIQAWSNNLILLFYKIITNLEQGVRSALLQ